MTFVSNAQTRIEQIEHTEEEINNSSIDETNHIVDENSNNDYEKILNYKVDIVVNTNSSLEITETIKVNSKGNNISRGIFRTFPTKRNLNNQSYKVKYGIISIKRDGEKDGYHKETSPEYLKIYIGKEDVILDPGIYTYEIKYEVNKQIGFFDSYDELYWNVNGTDWDFDIDEVEATVHLPNGADILQNACYTGTYGSNDKNCNSKQINETTMVWNAKNLNSKEGLTIAVGFKKGIVFPPPPPGFLEIYGITILLIIAFAYLSYYCYNLWKEHGIDPEKPTVYPQFSPPNNLSPAGVSYYHYEKNRKNNITATLVNLAVKKYIKIEEINNKKYFGLSNHKAFVLTKLKDEKVNNLPEEEFYLMKNLFRSSISVTIDGEYQSKISTAFINYDSSLSKQFEPLLKSGRNLNLLLKPMILFLTIFLLSFIISSYLADSDLLNLSVILLFSTGIPVAILYVIRKKTQHLGIGCVQIIIALMIFGNLITLLFIVLNTVFDSSVNLGLRATFIFFLFGIIGMFLMRKIIKQPPLERLQIQSDIEGFKMYLAAAEIEQIQFHNAPDITPDIFEKYLPYAIIFDVSDIWGRKFNALLQKSQINYQPDWYSGSPFDTIRFGSAIGSSLTETFNSTSTQPRESSGSYSGGSSSSGSSGSGSSGGGGGGGGGGGW